MTFIFSTLTRLLLQAREGGQRRPGAQVQGRERRGHSPGGGEASPRQGGEHSSQAHPAGGGQARAEEAHGGQADRDRTGPVPGFHQQGQRREVPGCLQGGDRAQRQARQACVHDPAGHGVHRPGPAGGQNEEVIVVGRSRTVYVYRPRERRKKIHVI